MQPLVQLLPISCSLACIFRVCPYTLSVARFQFQYCFIRARLFIWTVSVSVIYFLCEYSECVRYSREYKTVHCYRREMGKCLLALSYIMGYRCLWACLPSLRASASLAATAQPSLFELITIWVWPGHSPFIPACGIHFCDKRNACMWYIKFTGYSFTSYHYSFKIRISYQDSNYSYKIDTSCHYLPLTIILNILPLFTSYHYSQHLTTILIRFPHLIHKKHSF